MIKIITYTSPIFIKIIGGLLIALGISILLEIIYEGIIFIIFGLVMFFSRGGVCIDPKKKRLKRYRNIATLEFGSWHSLTDYSHLLVKKVKSTAVRNNGMQWKASSFKYTFYNVYLKSDKNIRGSIQLFGSKNEEVSKTFATDLGKELDIKVKILSNRN